MNTIDKVFDNSGNLLAIIVPATYEAQGIQFFTSNELGQQLGYMNRPPGYIIEAHVHNPIPRNIEDTVEALFIRKGKVRIDFYDSNKVYLAERILSTGDVILLISGGHGFTMLEQTEMIEVKQGPYANDKDKVRFTPKEFPGGRKL